MIIEENLYFCIKINDVSMLNFEYLYDDNKQFTIDFNHCSCV